MSLISLLGKFRKKTLDDLISGDTPVKMADLLKLDELQSRSQIVAAAKKLLQNQKHCHDGYDILGPLAADGDIEAQFIMGDFCEFVLERLEQAKIWYQRAAENGHSKAQWCIANLYMTGKGTEKDVNEAVRWYRKAADNGIPEAQFVMGEFFRVGKEIPQNLTEAQKWYELALRNGYTLAQTRLEQMAADKSTSNYKEKESTEDDYLDLDKKILQLPTDVIKAAEEGLNYFKGRNGFSMDKKKAFEKLSYAAERGHTSAQYSIAMCYFHGDGTVANRNKAIEWLTRASEAGMSAAQNELGIILFNRNSGPNDIKQAAYWQGKAADNGIVDAMFVYGAMLIQGQGVAVNSRLGLEYVKKAAKAGHLQAIQELKQLNI